MKKKRVAVICAKQLICDSLMHILANAADIEILGPWAIDAHAYAHLSSEEPDLAIVAETVSKNVRVDRLIARILVQFPSMPVIRVTLENNMMRFYSPHIIPASSSDLISLIHRLDTPDQAGARLAERKNDIYKNTS
jgi:hypothetical protein